MKSRTKSDGQINSTDCLGEVARVEDDEVRSHGFKTIDLPQDTYQLLNRKRRRRKNWLAHEKHDESITFVGVLVARDENTFLAPRSRARKEGLDLSSLNVDMTGTIEVDCVDCNRASWSARVGTSNTGKWTRSRHLFHLESFPYRKVS
jgi:hypothetical protein